MSDLVYDMNKWKILSQVAYQHTVHELSQQPEGGYVGPEHITIHQSICK
jgi:hypothetical protein